MEQLLIDYISSLPGIGERTAEYRINGLDGEEISYIDFAWKKSELPNTWVFLEYESNQKHPCTNILKVWPYLEANPQVNIIFIHYFENKSEVNQSSRIKLALMTGEKIKKDVGERFSYFSFFGQDINIEDTFSKIENCCNRFLPTSMMNNSTTP